MTRFEKDLVIARTDPEELDIILRERKAELDRLWDEGRKARNSFRATCIAQEYNRLAAQYEELDQYI